MARVSMSWSRVAVKSNSSQAAVLTARALCWAAV
jgi:hypothetical protein